MLEVVVNEWGWRMRYFNHFQMFRLIRKLARMRWMHCEGNELLKVVVFDPHPGFGFYDVIVSKLLKKSLQSHCRWRLNKFSMSTMSLFGINLSTNQQEGHVWNTRKEIENSGLWMDIFKNKVLLLTGFHTENLFERHSFNTAQKHRLQRKHLNFPTYSTHWTHLCEIKSNSKKGPLLYFLKEI